MKVTVKHGDGTPRKFKPGDLVVSPTDREDVYMLLAANEKKDHWSYLDIKAGIYDASGLFDSYVLFDGTVTLENDND